MSAPFKVFDVGHLWSARKPGGHKFEEIQPNIDANVQAGWSAKEWEQKRDVRIAIVGYGPSLRDTWPRLKDYQYIWTVSGAHDFLIDKGIIPTYHTDVDYRSYKKDFIRQPHPHVEYCMASAVHPHYMAKLIGMKLRMFHAEGPPNYRYEGPYPKIEASWDAGQQAILCALANGFPNQDWFGIDYSYRFTGTMLTDHLQGDSHAGPHHGARSHLMYVTANNTLFETTKTHLSAMFVVEDLLKEHPDLNPEIHGEGLLVNFLEWRRWHDQVYGANLVPQRFKE